MPTPLTGSRSTLGGTAVLMACACGTAVNSAKLLALAGVGATVTMLHPVFIGAAGALMVYGFWRFARQSAYLAMAAFALLALAAALTPPRVMAAGAMPWNSTQMAGAGIYLVAMAILAYAFWRAFPSPRPAASGTAMGGMVLATGCNCCLATGAMAGMAVTGLGMNQFQQIPILFWTGMAIVAAGLFRLGGIRAAVWVPAGALVIRYGPELLRLTGDWMVGDANLRTYPSYALTITGAGLVVYGFVVAYRIAGERAVDARSAETSQTGVRLAGV